jgi:Putative adhesin
MPARLPLTRGRVAALVLGLPVALAFIGWMAFSAVALASQVSYRVRVSAPATGRQARLTTGQANAVIRPGSGHRILASGTLSGSLTRPVFHWHPTAAGLALNARCLVPTGLCDLDFDVATPGGLPLSVSGGSGNLDVSGFRGRVTLSDGSGNISASGLPGTVSLSAGSGNVTASGLSGASVRLSNGSGDITASGLTGASVRLSNGSGNIDITGLAAPAVVSSDGSGDITLTFTRVPRRVTARNGSGNITIVLPRGATYQVDARSSSGDVGIGVKTGPSAASVISAIADSGDVSISYG